MHRDKLGLTHTFIQNRFARTYTHSAQILPPQPCTLCLSALRRWTHCPGASPCARVLSCNLPRFRAGYLAAVDTALVAMYRKWALTGEQVQMVAVGPRCCMETNKSAEMSLATVRPLLRSPSKGWGSAYSAASMALNHESSLAQQPGNRQEGSAPVPGLLQSPGQLKTTWV